MNLPLVLLPGMMCDARLFGPQIDVFSHGREVIVGDLTRHDTIHEMAAGLFAELPDKFALAGLSMGGIVAMEMAGLAAGRIERLALLDTNPFAEAGPVKARRAAQIRKVRQDRLRDVMRDEVKPNYLAEGPRKQEILDICMDMALSLGPEVFLRQSLALRDRSDQTVALGAYRGPTLVLCGEEDMLCPVSRHIAIHELLPHSVLEILPSAGHLPTLEDPEATNAAFGRWLAR